MPINKAERNAKIYAWRKATNSSRRFNATAPSTLAGITPYQIASPAVWAMNPMTTVRTRWPANMFAGHLVLTVVIGFIAQTAGLAIWYGVMPASVLGAVALNLLELLVAFLQAYIFAFLSALFIGMAVHQH